MNKADRQKVFDKFGGRCAYCGEELKKGWHVDHFDAVQRHLVTGKFEKPENDHLKNWMPSCASCNINKHGYDIETFRNLIAGFMKHLNENNTQYKLAKRYGLVQETGIKRPVFYYEEIYMEKQLSDLNK